MRRHSAIGRKIVVVCTALTALGAVAAAAVPAAAQPKAGPPAQVAAAQEPSSGGSSAATDLFKSLAEGAAGQVGGAAAGWAMSAMGLSTGDSKALASINSELQAISDQLKAISDQLKALTTAINALHCDTVSADIKPAIAQIDTYRQTYAEFIQQGSGTGIYPTASVPPPSMVVPWAMGVINTQSGIMNAIFLIRDALLPAGTAQGILEACLAPDIVPPPAPDSIGDFDPTWKTTLYYNTVENLVDYYYNYQAQGLLLLQEAYHYLAQQATGQTGNQEDPGSVCTGTTNATAQSYCNSASLDTNTVYEALASEFEITGLPYTDTQVILLNDGSDSPLFPRSLEAFTAAAGDNCPTPLTPADPCGITTANGSTVGNVMNVNYDGYPKWGPATMANLVDLVANRGSENPGVYMNQSGFENATGRILLTTAHAPFALGDPPDLTGYQVCFLKTDQKFICGNDDVNRYLVTEYETKSAPLDCEAIEWHSQSGLPGNVHGFYSADTRNKSVYGIECEWSWTTEPGWLVGNTGPSATQYRWPALYGGVGRLTCTNGRSPTNAGGVLTRCGTDFDTMFSTLVTRPATCKGTIVGLCGDQVHVSLTGPHAGEWSQVRDGDVTVALDGNEVRKISGTVLVQAATGGGTATVTFDIRRAGGKNAFYTGTVKIKADGDRVLVVPLRHAQIVRHADGTVSGQVLVPRGGHGTYTLTWSVLDNPD